MPQSIASAVCNRLGYNVEILKQRGAEPWFVLLVAFPIHWITIALLVCMRSVQVCKLLMQRSILVTGMQRG